MLDIYTNLDWVMQGLAINFYKGPHEKSELCWRAGPMMAQYLLSLILKSSKIYILNSFYK